MNKRYPSELVLSKWHVSSILRKSKKLRKGIHLHRETSKHELHPAHWWLLPARTDPALLVPDLQGFIFVIPRGVQMQVDESFIEKAGPLDLGSIEASLDVIYIMDHGLILRAFNSAWVKFAVENEGKSILEQYPLGACISDAFPDVVKDYLVSRYTIAMKEQKPFEYDYECSSPDQFRIYHQNAYPLRKIPGLVISNHCVESHPHRQAGEKLEEKFMDGRGFIKQCSSCRKLQNPVSKSTWIWVPEAVKYNHILVLDTLCPRCRFFYYPDL